MRSSREFSAVVLIALFALSAVPLMRASSGSPYLYGEESYFHARIAEEIASGEFTGNDNLISGGRDITPNPFHIVLALFFSCIGNAVSYYTLPFAGGMISAILFIAVLRNLGISSSARILSSIIFALSPAFIRTFSSLNPYAVSVPLALAGVLFLTGGKRNNLGVVLISAASLFGIFHFLMVALAFSGCCIISKKTMKSAYPAVLSLSIVLFAYHIPFTLFGALPEFPYSESRGFIESAVSDFGADFGLSIFALILAFIGAFSKKEQDYYSIAFVSVAVFASAFYPQSSAFLSMPVSVSAGTVLSSLIKRKWELKPIRNISITLLFCGLLFSAVSYSVRISSELPDAETEDALQWIRMNSEEGRIVFSHYSNGFWIQQIAERPVVADTFSALNGNINASDEIFHLWDIDDARKLIEDEKISLIFVTENLKKGKVWDKPDQELAFLLRDNETFKKAFSNPKAEIWRYVYSESKKE